MRRRASIFGTLAVAAVLVTNPGPVSRAVTSARNVERCFHDLRSAGGSLSPIERLLYSLVLANTKGGSAEVPVQAVEIPRT
ncbi:MAG TPA: hypothetical protein VME43_28030 [Bryobacteraceae bacterium]|nr:hypothetical protein [Bryobacteraceae bacterium]